jgi:PKHD-type hydroxylase|tara:strand:- start:632 stop:1225 length:594 start_codon:yes stop_codon:yes gene_type:complete
MKIDRKVTVWPFKLDELEDWAYTESIFSEEDCEKIIEQGKKAHLERATVFDPNLKIDTIRDSYVSWVYPNTELTVYYRRLTDVITELNNRFFKFDLYGFIEGLQFTYYKAPGGFYGKHLDRGLNGLTRKLSFVIQLSDPAEYEGGELLLHLGAEPTKIKKKRGYMAVFPSYSLHEVTPVTKGERYSLVGWITGPQFK